MTFIWLSQLQNTYHFTFNYVFQSVFLMKAAGRHCVELYLQHQLSELLITEERRLPVLLHVTDFILCSDVYNKLNVEINRHNQEMTTTKHNMFKLKLDGVQRQNNISLPFCFCKKSIVLCNMVDLSILRGWPWPCSMVQSSLMRTLNWSLLFFSDLLRDALQQEENVYLKNNWR